MSIPSITMEVFYLPLRARAMDVGHAVFLKVMEADRFVEGPILGGSKLVSTTEAGGSWIVTFGSLKHARLFSEAKSVSFDIGGMSGRGTTTLFFPFMGKIDTSLREEGVAVQFRMLQPDDEMRCVDELEVGKSTVSRPQAVEPEQKEKEKDFETGSGEPGAAAKLEPKSPMRARAN